MNKEKQIERFSTLWEKNSKDFGKKTWELVDNFLFFVEIPLPLTVQDGMQLILNELKSYGKGLEKRWASPEKMAITLALPGRMGTHFQGNQVSFMEDRLAKIVKKLSSFEIDLGNINCFESTIFREVIDSNENLFVLHKEICENIPFSQQPEYQYENFIPHISLFCLEEKSKEIFELSKFPRKISTKKMTVDCFNFGKIAIEDHNFRKIILKTFEF